MEITEEYSVLKALSEKHHDLYITISNDPLDMPSENSEGYVEYKRTISPITESKLQSYATQMLWRINENKKRFAVYFIGIDDDGSVVGLCESDLLSNIDSLIEIVKTIDGSIAGVKLIKVENMFVIRAIIKSKIRQSFVVDL